MISLLFPWQENHKILNKFVFIGMQECPKGGRVRHEWVSKRENPHKNCFTFSLRVISPDNVLLGGFQYSRWQKYRLETPKPKYRTLAKMTSCGLFYMGNWLLSSETLVYMWIEPYLYHSLYKSFQIMVCAIRSPMQWRPTNRKLSLCLTGNEINKAYCNMNIDWWTLDLVLFAIHLNFEQQFADYRQKSLIYSGHF